jgi:acyl-CoA dehydrogenase
MNGSGTSELRSLLGDVVTRLFTERVTPDLLASAETGEWPAGLWQAVEDNGLTLPVVAEAQGGAGGTWQDAHVVITAAGRHGAPIPLAETIVATWCLARARLEVPTGPLALAPVQPGESLALERAGGGWRLTGTAHRVPWGARAEHLVVVAPAEGALMVARVAGGQARVTPDRNLACEPRDTLAFEAVPVAAAAPAALPAGGLVLYGAMIRAAQMAGALEAILGLAVKYATERHQFGRPIAAFQAIQHNLAVVAGHVAAAGLAAGTAFRAAERGDPTFEIAVAKARVGEAAGFAAGIAHQVHGAIGFTYEHSLHFLTRRLWSWRAEFGAEPYWAAALGRQAIARGGDALWPFLTSR